jgi:hypothetical protein
VFDLDSLKPNRPEVEKQSTKKILCIIEGKLELKYINKIFQLNGYSKSCYALSEELIKVAWGTPLSKEQNIVNKKCNFQGGSRKDAKVPYPAIQAFELFARDLSIFDSIFIFFDGDKDSNREVESYFINKCQTLEIENVLIVSQPCFESTLIDFCYCNSCRELMGSFNEEKYPCDKYKNKFSSLYCFEGSKHLIANLTIKQIHQLNLTKSVLSSVNNIVYDFYEKNGNNFN